MTENILTHKENNKDWRLLEFYVPIEENLNEGDDFIIRGVAINETTTLNNVKYVAEELIKAAASFRDVPILLDHENKVKNIVGRTTEKVDFNSAMKRIDYEAKIMDKDIQEMIKDGRIKNVSIGAKVSDLTEEEDGSMKAIGIHGLELSLVAVPGDNQANLAQAIRKGLHLKEMANTKLDNKLNIEERDMTDEEKKIEAPEEESKEEAKEEVEAEAKDEAKDEVKDEVKAEEKDEEKAEEKVQNINVKVDTSEISEMKKQISELKELLVTKKKLTEVKDETKGVVSKAVEEAVDVVNSRIVEQARQGFAMYRDYSVEDSDTKLKRLVR